MKCSKKTEMEHNKPRWVGFHVCRDLPGLYRTCALLQIMKEKWWGDGGPKNQTQQSGWRRTSLGGRQKLTHLSFTRATVGCRLQLNSKNATSVFRRRHGQILPFSVLLIFIGWNRPNTTVTCKVNWYWNQKMEWWEFWLDYDRKII